MLAAIRGDLDRFRVRFDSFFSERTLHAAGTVEAGVAALEKAGDAYTSEGAVWFRTTDYGDTKDRVLVRGDGDTTYLAADVAYHLDKAGRGDDLLIDVLGADHHGYVARLRAVLAAGGYDPDMLEVPIIQLVSLLERGEAKKMSKRAGTVVTLGDLLDDIGVDAARFFLVQRSHETPLDLDLDLAREQSQENPVYYVQYAHARVHSILAQVADRPGRRRRRGRARRARPAERALVMRIAEWPVAVGEAEERRAPAPGGRLPDRAGARVPRLLPPLPRGGGAARDRGLPPGRVPRHGRHHPHRARPAGGRGAGADVGRDSGGGDHHRLQVVVVHQHARRCARAPSRRRTRRAPPPSDPTCPPPRGPAAPAPSARSGSRRSSPRRRPSRRRRSPARVVALTRVPAPPARTGPRT